MYILFYICKILYTTCIYIYTNIFILITTERWRLQTDIIEEKHSKLQSNTNNQIYRKWFLSKKEIYVETNGDVMGKEKEDIWWPNYFIILIQMNEYF